MRPVIDEPETDEILQRQVQTDEEYLQFLRGRPCIWCGAPPPSDPDHLRNRKWRESTRDDYTAVSSCRRDHNRRHNVGTDRMLELNGMKVAQLVEIVAMQLVVWFTIRKPALDEAPF